MHPDDRVEAADKFAEYRKNGADGIYENYFRMQRSDGSYAWIWSRGRTFQNTNGELIDRTLGTHIDVTESKRVSDALRESNENLNNLFNYANAPIIVWDLEHSITRFNHAFENLTGQKKEEVLGKHILLFPEERKAESLELIKKATSGESWKAIEIPVAHKSGKMSTLIWNSANIKKPQW